MHYPSYIIIDRKFKNISVSLPVLQTFVSNEFLEKALMQKNLKVSDGDITAANLMYQCPGNSIFLYIARLIMRSIEKAPRFKTILSKYSVFYKT